MDNQNLTQETTPQMPTQAIQTPSQLPKQATSNNVPMILGIVVLLIVVICCGIYFIGIQKNNSSLQTQNAPHASKARPTNSVSPTEKMADATSSNWQKFNSKSCGITINYPQDWMLTDEQFGPDLENGTNKCFEIDSPNLGYFRVEKLHLGVIKVFGDNGLEKVNIQKIDDFIRVVDHLTPTSALQNKTYGNLSGEQYFSTTGQYNYTNFVFIQNGSLYNIWWDRYGYKNDLRAFTNDENALIPSIISSVTLQ